MNHDKKKHFYLKKNIYFSRYKKLIFQINIVYQNLGFKKNVIRLSLNVLNTF